MTKKRRQFLRIGICFAIFLLAGFFYLQISRISAVNLEVNYPIISGQDINNEVNLTLPSYVKYLYNAGIFLGFFAVFISLIIAGATYILSPISAELRADAKDRAFGAISGLLILMLIYLIVITINPQLSIFKLNELPPTPESTIPKTPGVYLYNSTDCSDTRIAPNTYNVPDLGPQKNKIQSVGIIKSGITSFVSILYDNTNLWGKCQYMDPNQSCQQVSPFAASASVYAYDFNPNGDGVYFFRKSCFNDNPYGNSNDIITHCIQDGGGYYKVDNSQINHIYVGNLDNMQFWGVPEKEQDCIKYEKNGECAKNGGKPPSLAGENISSMIINGNYLVLLVYFNPAKDSAMSWSSCEEFPVTDDANRLGSRQIKWENIRNSQGIIPNYVIIIPIQQQ